VQPKELFFTQRSGVIDTAETNLNLKKSANFFLEKFISEKNL
jgi:hypothetical protein